MTCEEFHDVLDSYVTGRLPAAIMEAASRHASSCDACRADLDAAVVLAPAVAGLARSIEPEADLWPAVVARMRRPHRPWPALAAAAVILLAVASLLVFRPGPHESVRMTAGVGTDTGALLLLDAGYEARVKSLEEILARDRDRLSPATVRIIERNLAIIDRAIAESREALASDPSNPDLRALLQGGRAQKLSLLEQAARMAREL